MNEWCKLHYIWSNQLCREQFDGMNKKLFWFNLWVGLKSRPFDVSVTHSPAHEQSLSGDPLDIWSHVLTPSVSVLYRSFARKALIGGTGPMSTDIGHFDVGSCLLKLLFANTFKKRKQKKASNGNGSMFCSSTRLNRGRPAQKPEYVHVCVERCEGGV